MKFYVTVPEVYYQGYEVEAEVYYGNRCTMVIGVLW